MDEDKIANIIDLASAKSERSEPWYHALQKSKGAPIPSAANVLLILEHEAPLRGMLAYNAFRAEHLIMKPAPASPGSVTRPGPYPRPWTLEDVVLVQSFIQRVHCPTLARGVVEDAMLTVAGMHTFHPINDWLHTLKWDGIPRLDHWLINAFGCENTAYHRAIGAKFMIAAVRRVRYPGCKFDYMMVLEGSQGIGKSSCLRELFSKQWFSDAIPPDLASRDAAMALDGVWCLEFSEIEHLIRHELEVIKAFLSRAVERYRPPYGRFYVERPRQGVLVGTTNADDYLRDSTGNRRIWPVRCEAASVDWVKLNRADLWAEAAYRELIGETEWMDEADVQTEANSAQLDRMGEDLWWGEVSEYAAGKSEVTIPDILWHVIGVPRERHGKSQEMRIAAILRQIGWERITATFRGKVRKFWRPKDAR